MVLHTDRSAAAPGEYVYFKAYLTTGPQRQRYSPSTLVRVEPLHRDILSHGDSVTPADRKRKKSRDRDVETTPWTTIDTTGLIALQEAVVKADKPEVKESPSLYNIKSAITVHQDPDRPVETAILMSRIPGVTVSGDINVNPRITLPMRVVATGAPVLWVVDGIILADQGIGGHPFSLIPYTEIERIEFVVGPEAAIFGARGAGGAFLLYTRSGYPKSAILEPRGPNGCERGGCG